MANFFSLQDGNLTDPLVYGQSLTAAEVMSNTTGTMLLTSSLYSTNFVNTNANTISAIAVHLSARAVNPSGTLGLTVQRTASAGKFLDSSSNNLTITTNGTPYQNTFTPFSPNGWSGYFNGTTDALSIANDTAFVLSGNASFTMEAWVFPTKLWSSGSPHPLIDKRDLSNNISYAFSIKSGSNGTLAFAVGTGVAGGATAYDSMSTIPNDSWTHVAASYDGIKLRLYTNGNKVYESASTISIPEVNTQIRIARNTFASPDYYGGGISNFRIIKGTALYTTASFTPSSSPLTNISGTSLLTLQDNRFKDNSTNNFTLTANGSPVIKDSSPFTQVTVNPAVHGGAGYFNGSSSISVPSSTNYEFSTATDYTIEFWFYPTVLAGSSTVYRLIYYGNPTVSNGNNVSWGATLNSGAVGKASLDFWTYNGTTQNTIINTASIINVNTWNHYAIVTLNGKVSAYVNGVYSASANYTSNMNTSVAGAALQIGVYNGGGYFNGYLSNIRLIKNTALYTSNFTPSSSPLTNTNSPVLLLNTSNYGLQTSATETYAISSFTSYDGSNNLLTNYSQNWQILKLTNPLTANNGDYIHYSLKTSNQNQLSLMGSSTAVDETGISRVSAVGTPILTSFKPYSNFDNSWYLNGTTDWLVIPANLNFNLIGDFTIECWINTSTFSYDTFARRIFGFGANATNNLQISFFESGTAGSSKIGVWTNGPTNNIITGTIPAADGNWHHVAVSRYNNLLRLYVDGIQSGPAVADSTNFNAGATNPLSIGSYFNSANGRYNGYINQFRIVNGTAVYTTSSFIPPSAAPLEYIPNTVFLLKDGIRYDQALITNNIYTDALTGTMTNNNAVLSSASPFGTITNGSISFNGTNSYITLPTNSNLTLGGDFTIEFWANSIPAGGTARNYIGTTSWAAGGFQIWNHPTYPDCFTLHVYNYSTAGNGALLSSTTVAQNNVWYHVAVTRRANDWKMFVNGKLEHSRTSAATITLQTGYLGVYNGGGLAYYLNGCMANVRIIKGTCLYDSDFIVPSNPPLLLNGTSLLFNNPHSLTNYLYTNSTGGDFHIGGSLKGLNTESRTITIDTINLNNNNLYIHNKGTLSFPLTSSKTVYITGPNGLQITSDGTLNIGTSSSVIPLSTTHTIILSNTQLDVHNGGNLNVYGYPKLPYTYLNTDSVSTLSTFTVTDTISTNWLQNDRIIFTPNSAQKMTSFDTLILSSFVSSNTFKTTTSAVYNHPSIASIPLIPSVSNLSRNVSISGFAIRGVDAAKINICNSNIKTNYSLSYLNNIFGYSTLSGNVYENVNNTISFKGKIVTLSAISLASPNSRIQLPNNSLVIGTGPFTLEFWFKPLTDTTGSTTCDIIGTFVWATGGANSGWDLSYIYSSGKFAFSYSVNTSLKYPSLISNSISAVNVPNKGEWMHVAFGRNASDDMFIYINGINIGFTGKKDDASGGFEPVTTVTSNITLPQAFNMGSATAPTTPTVESNSNIGGYFTNGVYKGYGAFQICNLRLNVGQALYTSNFIPSFVSPTNTSQGSTETNVKLNALQIIDPLVDISQNKHTLTKYSQCTISLTDTPIVSPLNNLIIKNNIFLKNSNNGLDISNIYQSSNINISNNVILSTGNVGFKIKNTDTSSIILNNNYIIGSNSFGTQIENSSGSNLGGSINYNSITRGANISGNNYGTVSLKSIYSTKEGIYVDASTSNLSGLTFQNILVDNNSSVGFKVSGNNSNYLTPVTLNINGLSASNNLSVALEGYNIIGNVNSISATNNIESTVKTSIGNGKTIFDGLSSNVTYNNTTTPFSSNPYLTLTDITTSALTPYTGGSDSGGSFSFNGTSSTITVDASISSGLLDNLTFETGDFTMEAWLYYKATPNTLYDPIVFLGDGFNSSGPRYSAFALTWQSNKLGFGRYSPLPNSFNATAVGGVSAITINTWNHVAVTRRNGILNFWVNGINTGSSNLFSGIVVNPTSQTTLRIGGGYGTGANPYTFWINANIAGLKIVKGIALYTENFTPSRTSATHTYGTSFLLHYNYGNIFKANQFKYTHINILSALNYDQTVIKNANLSCFLSPQDEITAIGLTSNINKFEEFRLENSNINNALTAVNLYPIRNKLEGSYIFDNCNSDIYGLSSLALTGYQTDTYLETGISVMRENGLSGNDIRYLAAGRISYDSSIVHSVGNPASEKLEPTSVTTKLRSSPRYIPVKEGYAFTVTVFVKKSASYSGEAPRLMLRSNSALGYQDAVLATSIASNNTWELLIGTIPTSNTSGIFEVYVDCSGSLGSGTINIDDWNYS